MTDVLFISQSRMVRFEEYDHLPLERLELYQNLVQLRSVYCRGGFQSHLDMLNLATHGKRFEEGSWEERRRELLDIWHLPGLNGILVASQLLEAGFTTGILNHIDAEWDRFEQLYAASPEPPLVAISTTFHLSWKEVKRLTTRLRALDPDMEIVVGGAFANEQTINGTVPGFERHMRKHGIRYLLHGFNSESDLVALVRARKGQAPLDQVPNLAWLERDGTFRATTKRWNAPTLGARSVLWDQLDLPFLGRTVQLRTASGCPFACAFCSYPETAGGHYASDISAVETELERIGRLPGIEQVVFIDDTFNVPVRRFSQVLRAVEPYGLRWYSFLRCQYIDEDQARLMKDSGCAGVYLGVESANDQVLANMNKRAKRADFERGMALLKKYDIPMFVALVLGFPGETDETIAEDIDFLEQNGVDFYSLKEFYYMPHTSVHTDRERFGLTGDGNEWSHATMDSRRASAHKLEMYSRIKGSTYIDADTSLWYVAYLRDRGLSLAEVKAVQKVVNEMMHRDNAGRHLEKDDLMHDLARALGREAPACSGAPPTP
jgi:anaerobic magnesium-protoporphyrin IX monomethyl ester cyclase